MPETWLLQLHIALAMYFSLLQKAQHKAADYIG